jgi:hypothetical protein
VNDSGVLRDPDREQRVRLQLGDALGDVVGARDLHPDERAIGMQGEQIEHVEQVVSRSRPLVPALDDLDVVASRTQVLEAALRGADLRHHQGTVSWSSSATGSVSSTGRWCSL